MIATRGVGRRSAGSIEPGDTVRLGRAKGVVKTVDGDAIGVSWPWGKCGVSTFYSVVRRGRLKVLKRGGGE